MIKDYEKLKSEFNSVRTALEALAPKLELHLSELFAAVPHIDRVTSRIKSEASYLDKALKKVNGELKYREPIRELQDLVGARIVVYYKTDVEFVTNQVKRYFRLVEEINYIPDDVTKFGYEGVHFVCFIPNTVYSKKGDHLLPDFFELQIKTLFQHAWSQANHGLGYKPGTSLTYDEERKLAFIAAQSWGADNILVELQKKRHDYHDH